MTDWDKAALGNFLRVVGPFVVIYLVLRALLGG